MAEHNLSATPTHSRWNAALPPRLTISPGDTVHFECVDASGAQVHPGMTAEGFQNIDRTLIHALTGPVAIQGAAPETFSRLMFLR
ncbi:acetamidase/formamidase family protein [Granulicella sp. 5B5]|uniref:acetamidase/formamidase family protein n=1 Tax=Granulicella sp. 5B5 TaxID=1617967 RepID=UPI002102EA73|nr:acetamidase/formamidase family protein [Granulicella sp. 5B5]